MNKLWFKSGGFREHGKATDGDTEVLYDHAIPFLRYFDAQAGFDTISIPIRGALGERLGSRDWHLTFSNLLRLFISETEAGWLAKSPVRTIF